MNADTEVLHRCRAFLRDLLDEGTLHGEDRKEAQQIVRAANRALPRGL